MKHINILEEYTVEEVSGVVDPAVPHAAAAIIKEVAMDETQKVIEEMKVRLAKMEADKEKEAEEAAVEKAEVADPTLVTDPVVYRSELTGLEIRKSQGHQMLQMAQMMDTQAQALQASENALQRIEKEREEEQLQKDAATHLSNFPGEILSKTRLLAAVKRMSAEDGPEVLKMLSSANQVLAMTETTFGVSGQGDAGAVADGGLDTLVNNYVKEHGVSQNEAYVELMKTPEGLEALRKEREMEGMV